MPRQKIPDIEFNSFVIAELPKLFEEDKIRINQEYQRGNIWKEKQKVELIRSILNNYSIGVLVVFVNGDEKYEVLDGQQRIITIKEYLNGELNLKKSDIQKYSELNTADKAIFDAYSVYYLRLKSFDPDTKEEDVTQTFLRLQEGTALNKAEKINAMRGAFKNLFRETRNNNKIFTLMGGDKRFRFRLLAAELLLLELEGDFEKLNFPDLNLDSFKIFIKKYSEEISQRKKTNYIGNLNLLYSGLNYLLTAISPRDLVSFYLLVSYLRKNKADNSKLITEIFNFAEEFLKNVNSFSIYDSSPPEGCNLDKELFDKYLKYKMDARQATSPESLESRFKFMIEEYGRMQPFILKDKKRFHEIEEKRTLFFRQRGKCTFCNKPLDFRRGTSTHHKVPHSQGSKTDNLEGAELLHEKCHKKLEKQIKKSK